MRIESREMSNTLVGAEVLMVRPAGFDTLYQLLVTTPSNTAKEPLGLISIDGMMTGGAVHSITTLCGSSGEIPPMVTVSIGYAEGGLMNNFLARNVDLTPEAWPDFDRTYAPFFGVDNAPPTGSADRFLDFLVDELMPFIESEYGVRRECWTLSGLSFGGLFTTHALLSRPGAFRYYNAVSASFWFKAPLMFDRARRFAEDTQPLDASIYLTVGDQEDGVANARMVDSFPPEMTDAYLNVIGGMPDQVTETREMGRILEGRARLRVKATALPGETHSTVYLAALSQGLQWLHGQP